MTARSHGRTRALAHAKALPVEAFTLCREGKREVIWREPIQRRFGEAEHVLYRTYRAVERSIGRHGQRLLLPEWTIEGWECSLDSESAEVIALYADHGTHEQFHSEFKTDLDLERLPSGKFDTNDTVRSLAVLAYNCLRLIGQNALLGPQAPVRHPAQRRRLKTVMQEIIYRAARVLRHAGTVALDYKAQDRRRCPPRYRPRAVPSSPGRTGSRWAHGFRMNILSVRSPTTKAGTRNSGRFGALGVP